MEVLPLTRALRVLRNCCSYSNNQGRSNTTQNYSSSKPVRDKGAKNLNELIQKRQSIWRDLSKNSPVDKSDYATVTRSPTTHKGKENHN